MPRRLVLMSALAGCTLIACSADSISGPDLVRGRLGLAADGRIAFVIGEEGSSHIWVMNDDGTGATQLTNDPNGADGQPAWSPDGSKIAFYRQLNAPPYTSRIYVMDADGSNVAPITDGPSDGAPSWSPDGTRIVFGQYSAATGGDIYVVDADGSNVTQLTSGSHFDGGADWSVNDQIVFMSDRDAPGSGYLELYVMNSDGSSQTRVTTTAGSEQNPDWSPDGAQIVFELLGTAVNGMYVMDADGSNYTQLTNYGQVGSWSPDGDRIAFQGVNGWDIIIMDADGTNQTNITNNANAPSEFDPAWGSAGADPADDDGDGILDTVDESPLVVSTRFSDIPLGGATIGQVSSVPANTAYVIEDAAAPRGVKVTLTATGPIADGSRLRINLDGKGSSIRLAVPGTYFVTDPETDTTVEVTLDGPAELELTLNGSPLLISIAEGASATITEVTDANGVLQNVIIGDVTGDPGDVTLNGATVEPGADPVELAILQASLQVTRRTFSLSGTWRTGPSTVVDPDTEDVILEVGPLRFRIPDGLIRKRDVFMFNGTLGSAPDVRLSLEMRRASRDTWTVKATGTPVGTLRFPLTVSLSVGDVVGSVVVRR